MVLGMGRWGVSLRMSWTGAVMGVVGGDESGGGKWWAAEVFGGGVERGEGCSPRGRVWTFLYWMGDERWRGRRRRRGLTWEDVSDGGESWTRHERADEEGMSDLGVI